tara:strand:+ start:297 stop:683 length:387 start_codon:yes stop_codon:yes gene_type:complete
MNFIDTIGGNKKQRELITDVAYFCVDRLMPRMKTLEIEIQINNLKDQAVGYCMMQDDNRTFELEVDKKLDDDELITTVCHEMVHVKQYARNELGINDNHDGENYYDLPYEKEAYELQEILLEEYKEYR